MSVPEKLRLDLPLVLSGVDDAEDRCVTRLTDTLSGRPGIEEAHIVGGDGESPQLCVHYNPNEITLGRVRELVQSVGAQLGARGRAHWTTHSVKNIRLIFLAADFDRRAIDLQLCGFALLVDFSRAEIDRLAIARDVVAPRIGTQLLLESNGIALAQEGREDGGIGFADAGLGLEARHLGRKQCTLKLGEAEIGAAAGRGTGPAAAGRVEVVAEIREGLVVREDRAAFAGGEILARLKTETSTDTRRADGLAAPRCERSLAGVLEERESAGLGEGCERVEVGGGAGDVDGEEELRRGRDRRGHFLDRKSVV